MTIQKQRKRKGLREYFRKDRRAAAGCILLGIWILLAALVPLLSTWSYSEQNAAIQNSLPSPALMRIADVVSAIPSMLYVILITLVLGAGAPSIILGLCVAGWIDMARIVRGEILRLKGTDFARAAKIEGIPSIRILTRHLLPNAAGPITVNFIFLIPQAIFTEAFLSFLGIGIAAPAASLGTIIQEARSQMMVYPYQMVFPLLVLCVMMLALNLIGTSLEQRNRR